MSAIDWASAEVSEGTLAVALTDKPSKEWRERVTAVAERLGRDGVEVKKERLVVPGVTPGSEAEVRHLLESAVLQADADLGEEDSDEGHGDTRSDADREMTEAFRAFA